MDGILHNALRLLTNLYAGYSSPGPGTRPIASDATRSAAWRRFLRYANISLRRAPHASRFDTFFGSMSPSCGRSSNGKRETGTRDWCANTTSSRSKPWQPQACSCIHHPCVSAGTRVIEIVGSESYAPLSLCAGLCGKLPFRRPVSVPLLSLYGPRRTRCVASPRLLSPLPVVAAIGDKISYQPSRVDLWG